MKGRCVFLFTTEIIKRLQVFSDRKIRVDVHGMSKSEALRLLQNLIAMNRSENFTIEVVHGYRHGAAIKEAIYSELTTKKPIKRFGTHTT